MKTNCYLVINTDRKECIIIDPASNVSDIGAGMEEMGIRPVMILLTHGHFDHIGAAPSLAAQYRIPIYAGVQEKEMLENPDLNLTSKLGRGFAISAERWLEDREVMEGAGFRIEVLATPGHTRGGVCYYFEEAGVLFSGDTLFYEDIGRADLPTGNLEVLEQSVREMLQLLPDDTMIYPGHERETSVAHEKKHNPYV